MLPHTCAVVVWHERLPSISSTCRLPFPTAPCPPYCDPQPADVPILFSSLGTGDEGALLNAVSFSQDRRGSESWCSCLVADQRAADRWPLPVP